MMQIKMEANPGKSAAQLMVVGVYLNEPLAKVLNEIFGAGSGLGKLASNVVEIAADEGYTGKLGQVLSVPTFGLVSFKRLYLFGLGAEGDVAKVGFAGFRKLGTSVSKRLHALQKRADSGDARSAQKGANNAAKVKAGASAAGKNKSVSACICLRNKKAKGPNNLESAFALESIVESFILSSFSYDKYKS